MRLLRRFMDLELQTACFLVTTKRAKKGNWTCSTTVFMHCKPQSIFQSIWVFAIIWNYKIMLIPMWDQNQSTEDQINTYVNATDRLKYPLPNTWFDVMFKAAPQLNNSISLSGGSDNLKGRFSFRQQDQEGIIKKYGCPII